MTIAPRVFLSSETIQAKVEEIGVQLNGHYAGRRPVVLGLLRGCVPFLSCLMRQMQFSFDLEFCQSHTYVDGTEPDREPSFQFFGTPILEGRDILVIDDIIDTGATLVRLLALLKERGAATVKLCTLLDKPARRKVSLTPDWVGFEIPDRFVVGYGMDHNGDHRGLSWIGTLE
jgi:hypoxanthine phosphoribosyltransferase